MIYENKTAINEYGYVVDLSVLLIDGKLYEFELKDGQQLVDCPSKTYVKPRWNGSEWIETATQEEIGAKKNEPPTWLL